MRENVEKMPQEELTAYGRALMSAYGKGGAQMVLGAQMTRREIMEELQAVGAELKARELRMASTRR